MRLLQAVPVTINGQTVYVDLRDGLSHSLLAGSPWSRVPWEAGEQQVMRRFVRPGDTAFDVGAHIGLHMILLADLVGPAGHVHAFEPNARRSRALATTVASRPNTTLHEFGLSDRAEVVTLFVPQDESMASLSDWTGGRVGPVSRSTCEVKRLDDLLDAGELPLPAFIKCDVEGAEHAVFAGARRLLDRRDAPVILYEANRLSARAFGLDASAATELLRSLPAARYAIHHVLEGALVPIDVLDPGCEHFNLLAIPRARQG